MKKRGSFIIILVLTTAFSFYRAGSPVAMAAEQIAGPTAGPEAENESAPEPEPGVADRPATETEDEPEPEQNADHTVEPETERIMEYTAEPEPEESVSTGQALMEWLESHKNIGGTVKLTDHVTLDGVYCYCPDGPNMPTVYVDTNQYTITVTGVAEFMSDHHLTFSGRPDGKGIFYVAEKGTLSMQGITVESETRALWQEEGAGLVVSDCRTTGSIRYAETPFVVEPDPVCVVVEKGQTVNDVLPEYLCCRVNRQGEVSSDDTVPLVWNLEGTERQQEERLRFQMQGFFLHAASVEPVRCTVVYNDYPLTFEEVHASVNGNSYIFKGWYTKPEEACPYTLLSEYSFDAENWLVSNETMVDGTCADFVIVVDGGQYDRAAHPYIYIRLQRNDNGTRSFSNVLCYAADNLDCVEDIGGSRGGGTSIINPPDEPQQETGGSSSEEEKPKQKPDSGIHEEDAKPEAPADTVKAKEESGVSDSAGSTTSVVPSKADGPDGNAGQPLYAEAANTDADRALYAAGARDAENPPSYTDTEYTESETDDNDNTGKGDSDDTGKEETVTALPAYGENGENLSHMGEGALRTENRRDNYLMIAAGFALLSAFAGAAGFYIRSGYSHSGTKR